MSTPSKSSYSQAIDLSDVDPNSAMVLRPITVPAHVASQIPDGQMVVVDTAQIFGASNGTSRVLPAIGATGSGTAASVIVNQNAALTRFGFSGMAAGENSIGLIGIPRWWTPGAIPPEGLHAWGHTASFVRVNGQIKVVRGFVPESLVEAAIKGPGIKSGSVGVDAAISNDILMFANTGARTIEWPVSAEMALQFSKELPPPGIPPANGPQLYTGRPGMYVGAEKVANCVDWACTQVEGALGGRVGYSQPGGGTRPLVEPPKVESGLQGEYIKFTSAAAKDGEVIGTMPGAIGRPVVSTMPRYIRLLKIGGRVMILVGVGIVAYETYKAPDGQRTRVLVREGAGLVGGIVGGMAMGAVCGPGVLVCSIVFGVVGGLVGYYVASEGAEMLYDYAAEDKHVPAKPIKLDPKAKPPWNKDPKNPWPDGEPGKGKPVWFGSQNGAGTAGLSKEAKAIYNVLPASGQEMTVSQVMAKLAGRYNSVDLALAWEELGRAGKAQLVYDYSNGRNGAKVRSLWRITNAPATAGK